MNNPEEVAQIALDCPADRVFLNKSHAEACCLKEKITTREFLERFARYIVDGYVAGRFNWDSCDSAMNNLSALMAEYLLMPDYAWKVFLAFDAGEYHPNTPNLSPDEVTRPLIDKIIAQYHNWKPESLSR